MELGEDCEVDVSSINVRYFPLPYIQLIHLDVQSNSNQAHPFEVQIDEARIYVNPFQYFLNKNRLIWSVALKGPQISLSRKMAEEIAKETDQLESVQSAVQPVANIFKSIPIAKEVRDFFSTNVSLSAVDIESGKVSLFSRNPKRNIHFTNLSFDGSASLSRSQLKLSDLVLSGNVLEGIEQELLGGFSLTFSSTANLIEEDLNLQWNAGASFHDAQSNKRYFISPIRSQQTFKLDGVHLRPQEQVVTISGLVKGEGDVFKWRVPEIEISLSAEDSLQGFDGAILKVRGEVLQSPMSEQETRVSDINFNAKLQSSATGYSVVAGNSSLKIGDISVELADFTLSADAGFERIDLANVRLSVGGQILTSNGTVSLKEETSKLNFEGQQINVRPIMTMLAGIGIESPYSRMSGNCDLNLEVSTISNGWMQVRGVLALNDLVIPSLDFRSKKLKLNQLNLNASEKSGLSLNTQIELAHFAMKVPKNDQYSLALGTGAFQVAVLPDGAVRAGGDFVLDDFGFADNNVRITKVDTKISQLVLDVRPDTRVEVKLNVDGNSILLETDGFSVKRVNRVRGPVTVMIGSKRGYVVEGIGKVQGGEMGLWDRSLTDFVGEVDFIISSPNKRFRSQNILGKVNGELLRAIDVDFTVEDEQYLLRPSLLSVFGGEVNASGSLGRKKSDIELDVDLKNVDAQSLLMLVRENDRPSLTGKIESFSGKFKTKKKSLLKSLSGEGKLKFIDGVFKEFALDESLQSSVGKALDIKQERQPSSTTVVERLELDYQIQDQVVSSQSIELAGRFYTFKGKGNYTFGKGFDIPGSAVFAEKTIGQIGGPVKMLRDLLGSIGRIEIPVRLKGPVDKVEVETDSSRLLSVISPGRAVKKVGEGVGDIFKGIKDVVTGSEKSSPSK
jgi:hypothetical protein